MLRAIQLMGWPLDMICSVDIWATETIPAELPPMVKFKDEYDQKVLDWFGVPVTRLCAVKREREREKRSGCPTNRCSTSLASANDGRDTSTDSQRTELEVGVNSLKTKQAEEPCSRLTYQDVFYRSLKSKKTKGEIYGFPIPSGNWCTAVLKQGAMTKCFFADCPKTRGVKQPLFTISESRLTNRLESQGICRRKTWFFRWFKSVGTKPCAV